MALKSPVLALPVITSHVISSHVITGLLPGAHNESYCSGLDP